MDEEQIRRLFISDKIWYRTSDSWKSLKPNLNFNEQLATDETVVEYYLRLKKRYNIPFQVLEQWIYPLYYDENSVINYGWIDYNNTAFKTVTLHIDILKSIYIVKDYRTHVDNIKKAFNKIEEFRCSDRDREVWKQKQTWRVPPIIMDVSSFPSPPSYCEIYTPLQLIEGHTRLGYLLCLYENGFLRKNEHKIYLMSNIK